MFWLYPSHVFDICWFLNKSTCLILQYPNNFTGRTPSILLNHAFAILNGTLSFSIECLTFIITLVINRQLLWVNNTFYHSDADLVEEYIAHGATSGVLSDAIFSKKAMGERNFEAIYEISRSLALRAIEAVERLECTHRTWLLSIPGKKLKFCYLLFLS